MTTRLMPTREVAERVGRKETTVMAWARRGFGPPAVRLPSGGLGFPADKFEAWFDALPRASA